MFRFHQVLVSSGNFALQLCSVLFFLCNLQCFCICLYFVYFQHVFYQDAYVWSNWWTCFSICPCFISLQCVFVNAVYELKMFSSPCMCFHLQLGDGKQTWWTSQQSNFNLVGKKSFFYSVLAYSLRVSVTHGRQKETLSRQLWMP